MFTLHPKLKEDLDLIAETKLNLVFMMPNSENPWVILVPKRENIKELHELSFDDQVELLEEINKVSRKMELEFKPDKINIGALGNMVPQLHIHIISRFKSDKAWPGAIWGNSLDLDEQKYSKIVQVIKNTMSS